MTARRRVGYVRADFSIIERFAKSEIDRMPAGILGDNWSLSRSSSLHRCKNGTYTLCLIWKSADGLTLSSTYRGLRMERA